jgi:hypothetical protein
MYYCECRKAAWPGGLPAAVPKTGVRPINIIMYSGALCIIIGPWLC